MTLLNMLEKQYHMVLNEIESEMNIANITPIRFLILTHKNFILSGMHHNQSGFYQNFSSKIKLLKLCGAFL